MNLNYLKEKIKDELSVKTVAEHYLGYPKIGNRYHCHITPTETRDNLAVYDDHWHCFYCNNGGDVIELVQSIFDLDYRSAMDKISQDFGIADETKTENLTPEMRKRIFEADKARVVRICEKRRAEEREKKINRQIESRISELNKTIADTDSTIRTGKLTDSELDKALEQNINAEKRLRELLVMSDIMSNKTFEGDGFWTHPETTDTEKQERKNRLIAQIMCQKVVI